MMNRGTELLDRLESSKSLTETEYRELIELRTPELAADAASRADKTRRKYTVPPFMCAD